MKRPPHPKTRAERSDNKTYRKVELRLRPSAYDLLRVLSKREHKRQFFIVETALKLYAYVSHLKKSEFLDLMDEPARDQRPHSSRRKSDSSDLFKLSPTLPDEPPPKEALFDPFASKEGASRSASKSRRDKGKGDDASLASRLWDMVRSRDDQGRDTPESPPVADSKRKKPASTKLKTKVSKSTRVGSSPP